MIFLLQLPALLYRWILSPILHNLCGPGCGCRHTPSCSCYWIEALKQHGPRRGLALGVQRILSCHPWGSGGYDPVPKKRFLNSHIS